jgi:hypothetical protein
MSIDSISEQQPIPVWDIKGTPTLGKFHKALALAQAEIRNPPKNKTAKIGSQYTFDYADLPSGIEIIRGVLAKCGIAFYQAPTYTARGNFLVTRMAFEDEWIEVSYPLTSSQKATDVCIQITLLRRYSLFPLAGVAGEDDVDGDALDSSGVKPAVLDETPQLDMLRKTFSAAKTLNELSDARLSSSGIYGQLSSVGQAACRRAYVEFEKRLGENVGDSGEGTASFADIR